MIEVRGLTKRFKRRTAVEDLSFTVGRGQVVGFLGPNGAGKTTLCDVISGKTIPTTGNVHFDRKEITHRKETDIALMGIGRKFQTPTVFDSLTTFENM